MCIHLFTSFFFQLHFLMTFFLRSIFPYIAPVKYGINTKINSRRILIALCLWNFKTILRFFGSKKKLISCWFQSFAAAKSIYYIVIISPSIDNLLNRDHFSRHFYRKILISPFYDFPKVLILKETRKSYFCVTPQNHWLMFISWKF